MLEEVEGAVTMECSCLANFFEGGLIRDGGVNRFGVVDVVFGEDGKISGKRKKLWIKRFLFLLRFSARLHG
jgi:hypothetical protein